MPIKTVPIDVGMVTTVNWLNSFLAVHTVFCCEGNEGSVYPTSEPYVMFLCWDSYTLATICEKINSLHLGGGFNYAHIFIENFGGTMRYTIRFLSKDLFNRWKNRMQFLPDEDAVLELK